VPRTVSNYTDRITARKTAASSPTNYNEARQRAQQVRASYPAFPSRSTKVCFNCRHHYDTVPFPQPLEYDSERDAWLCGALFCSPRCCKRHLLDRNQTNQAQLSMLVTQFARSAFGIENVTPAPPVCCLDIYEGGYMTIEQYRDAQQLPVRELNARDTSARALDALEMRACTIKRRRVHNTNDDVDSDNDDDGNNDYDDTDVVIMPMPTAVHATTSAENEALRRVAVDGHYARMMSVELETQPQTQQQQQRPQSCSQPDVASAPSQSAAAAAATSGLVLCRTAPLPREQRSMLMRLTAEAKQRKVSNE
jgi:hypothetical protein